jgi:hypothetical protein
MLAPMIRASLLLAVFGSAFAFGCGDDGTTPPDAGGATWQLLGEGRPSSLLAAWASSVDDAWVVGGREGAGGAPVAYHFDGTAWTSLDTGLTNVDLWQVFGFAGGDVFLAGSNGTILRYRDGAFETIPTPSTDIVFGLWGSAPDDVWAVGGQTTGRAFVWHYTGGAQFDAVSGVPAELDTGGAVWKVVGRAANDVWMSASRGLVLHWDGQALSNEHIGTTEEALFSIGCGSERCVTVGGVTLANGVLYEDGGAGWSSHVPTDDGPVWRGITPTAEIPYVVGAFGSVIRRTETGWVSEPHGLTQKSLHAAWGTADGSVFAVGGDFDQPITKAGVLLFKGSVTLPALP